jgi:hypothetical protein
MAVKEKGMAGWGAKSNVNFNQMGTNLYELDRGEEKEGKNLNIGF